MASLARMDRGSTAGVLGLGMAAIGLPSSTPSATRKSKRLDQAEWARRTEAAAWSPAQEAKAARRAGRLRSGRPRSVSSPRSSRAARRAPMPSTSRR